MDSCGRCVHTPGTADGDRQLLARRHRPHRPRRRQPGDRLPEITFDRTRSCRTGSTDRRRLAAVHQEPVAVRRSQRDRRRSIDVNYSAPDCTAAACRHAADQHQAVLSRRTGRQRRTRRPDAGLVPQVRRRPGSTCGRPSPAMRHRGDRLRLPRRAGLALRRRRRAHQGRSTRPGAVARLRPGPGRPAAPTGTTSQTEHRYFRGHGRRPPSSTAARKDVTVPPTARAAPSDHAALAGLRARSRSPTTAGGPRSSPRPSTRLAFPTATRDPHGGTVNAPTDRHPHHASPRRARRRRRSADTETDHQHVRRDDGRRHRSTTSATPPPAPTTCAPAPRYAAQRHHDWSLGLPARSGRSRRPAARRCDLADAVGSDDAHLLRRQGVRRGAVQGRWSPRPTRWRPPDHQRRRPVRPPTKAVYDTYGRPRPSHRTRRRLSAPRPPPTRDHGHRRSGHRTAGEDRTPTRRSTTITELDRAWGGDCGAIDADGSAPTSPTTPSAGSPKVWLPGGPRPARRGDAGSTPTGRAGQRRPRSVTTELRNDGGYRHVLRALRRAAAAAADPAARAPGGGRVITDTFYDSAATCDAGTTRTTTPARRARDPVRAAPTPQVPGQTSTPTTAPAGDREASVVNGRGEVAHHHQLRRRPVTVDPPAGDTADHTIVDAPGRPPSCRQYHGDSPTGAYDATTLHLHPRRPADSTVTDPAGNTWTYNYDLRGRLIRARPGHRHQHATPTTTRTGSSRPTDAAARPSAYSYDALGRKTAQYDITEGTGTQLAELDLRHARPRASRPRTHPLRRRQRLHHRPSPATTSLDRPDRHHGHPPRRRGRSRPRRYEHRTGYNPDGTRGHGQLPGRRRAAGRDARPDYDDLGMPPTQLSSNRRRQRSSPDYCSPLAELLRNGCPRTGSKTVDRTYALRGRHPPAQDEHHVHPATASTAAARPLRLRQRRQHHAASPTPPRARPADNQCFRYDYLRRLTEAWTAGRRQLQRTTRRGGPRRPGAVLVRPTPTTRPATAPPRPTRPRRRGDTTRTYAYPGAGLAAAAHRSPRSPDRPARTPTPTATTRPATPPSAAPAAATRPSPGTPKATSARSPTAGKHQLRLRRRRQPAHPPRPERHHRSTSAARRSA